MTAPTTAPAALPAPPAGAERVERLTAHAAEAAAVRALTTHPDVIALRVERVRAQVDALLWAGIVLGLAFTMVNVQTFAATGAAAVHGRVVGGVAARPHGVAGAAGGAAR